jgi:hypothetical protein
MFASTDKLIGGVQLSNIARGSWPAFNGYHDVRTNRPGNIHRHVVGKSSVHEASSLHLVRHRQSTPSRSASKSCTGIT